MLNYGQVQKTTREYWRPNEGRSRSTRAIYLESAGRLNGNNGSIPFSCRDAEQRFPPHRVVKESKKVNRVDRIKSKSGSTKTRATVLRRRRNAGRCSDEACVVNHRLFENLVHGFVKENYLLYR